MFVIDERIHFTLKNVPMRKCLICILSNYNGVPVFNLRYFIQIVRCCFINIMTRVITIQFQK